MNIDLLIQHMENKLVACKKKMDASIEKGSVELSTVFSNEYQETQITLYLLNKATQDIQYYANKEVREKLLGYIISLVYDSKTSN